MLADYKGIYSPDYELESYLPDDPTDFSVFVQVFFGPKDAEGSESFDFTICTPKWLCKRYASEIVLLKNMIMVPRYDYGQLVELFRGLAKSVSGADWNELGTKLSRYGRWEFEDYQS